MGRCEGSGFLEEGVVYMYRGHCKTLLDQMYDGVEIHVFSGGTE